MASEQHLDGVAPIADDHFDAEGVLLPGIVLPKAEVTARSTALMIIDMQYMDAHPDYGIGLRRRQEGAEGVDYFFSRLKDVAIPNTQRMMAACRQTGIPVIHVRVMNLAADSSDTSRRYKAKGMLVPPGSKWSEILEELAPIEGEIVLSKTTSNVFVSTNADFVLRNMGIDTLIMTGVMTNNCVESSVRGASDLGYEVLLVDDACSTWLQEKHDFAMKHLDGNFAVVKTTAQIVDEIAAAAGVRAVR
jgi:nicotinamidase-related amidase